MMYIVSCILPIISSVGLRSSQETIQNDGTTTGPACQCEQYNPMWTVPQRTVPGCFFFDLGAADGNTFMTFLGKSPKWKYDYDTKPFTKDQCISFLLEANPRFTQPLTQMSVAEGPGKVHVMGQTAVYMCDKPNVEFFIDPQATGWGSSLDQSHPDVKVKNQSIPVNMVNLNRLLQENTIIGDTVVIKMDIEGAEWDILPCLAGSPSAHLIDHLYLEDHCPTGDPATGWCPSKGQAGHTKAEFDHAVNTLKVAGVDIPYYNSPMFTQK